MDLWHEVSPGCGVWYITREMYMSICVCVANRTPNRVGVMFRWKGDPRIDNAVVLAPICGENKSNTTHSSGNSNSSEQGSSVSISRFIHPHSTVFVAGISPADDLAPMTLRFTLHMLEERAPGVTSLAGSDEEEGETLERAARQSRAVREWLQHRHPNHSS